MSKAREAAARAHRGQMGILGGDPVNAAIDAFLAALSEDGLVIVPTEANDEMARSLVYCDNDAERLLLGRKIWTNIIKSTAPARAAIAATLKQEAGQ